MAAFAFYFDFACPYAYLASVRVRRLVPSSQVELRPVLLGGIFNALGHQPMQTSAPAKQRYIALDMQRQAALHDIPLSVPARHPIRTVDALRLVLAAAPEQRETLIERLFRAYWVEGRAVDERETLRQLADEAGLEGAALVARLDDPEVKADLRARTDHAIERGVFGVPTFELPDGELFWGQDRLPLALRAAGLAAATADHGAQGPAATPPGHVRFFFDFSSPFAYLASEAIEAHCARHGATLEWHPMLLGAVFKEVGAPIVPFATMPPAKQQMATRDMDRFAALHAAPFQFPSRFPMRTVDALRLYLAAEEQAPARATQLAHRIFRAYWAEDRDINDLDVLAECCRRVELDPEPLLEARSTPPIKQRLIERTAAAVEAGVFGAPSFVVTVDGRTSDVIWGQDRLDVVSAWLEGRLTL